MSLSTLNESISFVPNFNNNWHIILHEDPSLSASYVVDVLVEVLGYSYDIADKIMQEALCNGKAIAKTTTRELALHYQDQLEEKELTITIEEVR